MRGPKPVWAEFGHLRVVDGDDIALRDASGRERRYRVDGYDAPETHNFRSRRDRWLEEKRGIKAMYRLAELIRNARSVYLLPESQRLPGRGERYLATVLVDGRDVAQWAIKEGWGVRLERMPDGTVQGRKETDWGDESRTFPDHLPLPEEYNEEDFEHRD